MPVIFVNQNDTLTEYIATQLPEVQGTLTDLISQGRFRELSQYVRGVLQVETQKDRREVLVRLLEESGASK